MRVNRLMNYSKYKTALISLVLLLANCASLLAEEGDKPPEKKPDTPAKSDDSTPKSADPTQASSRLRQVLRGPERSERTPPPAIKIPEITLKGLLQAEGKPASAVLEIKGKGHVSVVAGSRILLNGSDNGALLVKKVGVEGVEIEVPGVKEMLVVK